MQEAPPAPPVTSTMLAGGEVKETGQADADLSRSAQKSLEKVEIDTSQINTSAGERPTVDVTGEAYPSQLGSFQSESTNKVQT